MGPTIVTSWDGFARLSRTGDGIVVIFRNSSQATEAVVKLTAPPDAVYEARSVIRDRPLGTVTAAVLGSGWSVPLEPGTHTDVIELRRR